MFRFWERTIKVATQSAQRQFLRTFEEWLQSVVDQAVDRETEHKRDILSYMKLRRITVGLLPSLAVVGLEVDFPDEVLYHPTIQKMSEYCADLIAIDNVRRAVSEKPFFYDKLLMHETCFRILYRIQKRRLPEMINII